MRAKRVVIIVAISLGALLVLAILFAAFAMFTGPGAKLALRFANGRDLPVRAQTIEGMLARRFTLLGVEVQIGPVEASLDTVTVTWRPMALRSRRVDVTDVTIAGARVRIALDGTDTTKVEEQARNESGSRWILMAHRVHVRNATVDAPGNVHVHDVRVDASGGPDGYRADVYATGSAWRFENLRAFVRASGNSEALTADSLEVQTLGGVVRGNAFLRWTPDLSWRGHLDGEGLRVGELADTSQDWLGAVSFDAKGIGSLAGDSTRIDIDVASLEGTMRDRPLSAHGRVSIKENIIEASDASVTWGRARATLAGSMAEVADVRLDATVPSLAEILPRAHGSARVRGRISGSPSQLEVDVNAEGRGVRVDKWSMPDFDATIDATLSAHDYVPHAVDVRRGDIRIGDGRLATRGTVAWSDGIVWDATVAAERFEVSTVTPSAWNLRGPISTHVTSSGLRRGKELRGSVAIDSLSGSLRDRALRGNGSIAVDRGELDIDGLLIEWGDTHARADGHVGKMLDLTFDVASRDLSLLDSSLHGSVTARGTARGARNRPTIDATIIADSVHTREYAVHHLDGKIDADLTLASPSDIRLVAFGASRGESVLDTVRVDVTGPRDGHRASVMVRKGELSGTLTLRGTYADSTWSGVVEDLRFRHPVADEWRSTVRAPVFVSRSRVAVDSLALASGKARLFAHGSWQRGDTTRAEADLRGLELARFQQHKVADAVVTGSVEGSAAVTIHPKAGMTARVELIPGPGEIALGGNRIEYSGRVTGRADSSGVFALVDLDLTHGGAALGTIDGNLSIAGYVPGRDSLGTQPLEGKLDLNCQNIGPVLAVFAPMMSSSSGVLTGHLEPKGAAGDFRIRGNLELAKARFDLRSGLRLRDTEISLVSDGTGGVELKGGVTSGGGRVSFQATSARNENGWINGALTAKGERFQLIDQPDAKVFVSPDLNVELAKNTAVVTGTVRVPYARIETTQMPASAASASSDVVIVEDTLSTRPTWQVRTQVRVALGDSVYFNGFGLRTRLAGSLDVDDERGRPTQGTGEIQIAEGKYRAFGNELTIDPGRFVFGGGSIDNPGLDVRAYRGLSTQNIMESGGEIVGVNLRGTLRRPEFSVFSSPPMSETEIMSYLLTGHSSNTSSSNEQSALAGAALLIGMQQGSGMTEDIGKKLALDEAYLEGGETSRDASFVAGKYLSPKLYVSYATGLFERTNTFRARYSLSSKWTLQGESGDASSTDLLYRFERGK